MIFDWINGNTIGTIPNRNIKKQEFCWIEHLNEIFCHQSNQIEEVCSLFSTTGNLVRCVIVILNNIHQVNSISNNKNNFEVYLNVFDKTCSKNSILILDKDFLLIRTIANEITNLEFKINYTSEIQIFNVEYKIFHYTSNMSLLQEKMDETRGYFMHWSNMYSDIYFFDKLSYSIVGVIKTNDKLITIYGDKMLFLRDLSLHNPKDATNL